MKRNFDYSKRKPANYWTLERCKKDALKYTLKTKWQVKSNGAYKAVVRNGWYDECTSHMLEINKPHGYWTKERCKEDALNFKTKIDWKINGTHSYNAAQRSGWSEECSSHMTPLRINWTLDMCKEEALKYKSRTKWSNNSSSYSAALIKDWLDECCKHMTVLRKKWTLNECIEDALIYKNKRDWSNTNGGGYSFARNHGWLEKCCGHMDVLRNEDRNKRQKWTFEKCLKNAKKYNTIKEWKENSSGYDTAYRNGWLKKCKAHMKTLSGNKKRLVYCILFYNEKNMKSIYIGLTWNTNQRINGHMTRDTSPVFKHMTKYKLKPKFVKLTDYIDEKDAQKIEEQYQELAKNKNYNILFKNKAGALGGCYLIWTHNKVKKEALKYNDRSIWRKKSFKSYDAACRHGWLKEVTSHMLPPRCKPPNYWTLERCKEMALKYKTRTEWSNNDTGSYQAAQKYGWFEECASHMPKKAFRPLKWTFEKCKEMALKYTTKTNWSNNSSGSHQAAYKNGWFDVCTFHMK